MDAPYEIFMKFGLSFKISARSNFSREKVNMNCLNFVDSTTTAMIDDIKVGKIFQKKEEG